MKKEIFADGIVQLHFSGNMVHFDFMTLQPEEGKTPVPESKLRVIIPPQGFLGMFDSMQRLIDKLVDAGVLQKNEPKKEIQNESKAKSESKPRAKSKKSK